MTRSCTQKIKEPTSDIEDGNEKHRLTIDRGQRETQDQRGHGHHSGSSDASYSSSAGDHGRKRLGKMAQELSRTRRSPPPILTFDQASDEGEYMHEEQFRAMRRGNLHTVARALITQSRRYRYISKFKDKDAISQRFKEHKATHSH